MVKQRLAVVMANSQQVYEIRKLSRISMTADSHSAITVFV